MRYLKHFVEIAKNKVKFSPINREEKVIFNEFFKDLKLPAAYMEFIKLNGNGVKSGFMAGDSIYLNELYSLRKWATELLDENDSAIHLTTNDFVFWMSQGCEFCIFRLDEGDNPPVYWFCEGKKDKLIKIADHFTDFLINVLQLNKETFVEKT